MLLPLVHLHVARERMKAALKLVEDSRFDINSCNWSEFNQWCDVPECVPLSQKTTVKQELSAWSGQIQTDPSLEGTNKNEKLFGGCTRCCGCNKAELEDERVTLQREENRIIWSKPFGILTVVLA